MDEHNSALAYVPVQAMQAGIDSLYVALFAWHLVA